MFKTITIVACFFVANFTLNYIATPLTAAGWLKSKFGERAVHREIRKAYSDYGLEGVENYCIRPIRKSGFAYTCDLVQTITVKYKEAGVRNQEVVVTVYDSMDSALSTKTGREYYSPQRTCSAYGCSPASVYYASHADPIRFSQQVVESRKMPRTRS